MNDAGTTLKSTCTRGYNLKGKGAVAWVQAGTSGTTSFLTVVPDINAEIHGEYATGYKWDNFSIKRLKIEESHENAPAKAHIRAYRSFGKKLYPLVPKAERRKKCWKLR